jgi:cob(I)alamin adenosyltransferase
LRISVAEVSKIFMEMQCDQRIKGRKGYGLIQLIHGHGKGKTTAALGQAVRCAGAGKKALIVYFDKGGTSHYSERAIIDQIDAIDYVATGRDRIDPVTNRFDFSITEEDKIEAGRGIEVAKVAMESGEYDLVVLDEINSTQNLGMLTVESVLDALASKAEATEVIMTGRNPAQEFLDAAHLITEMRLDRHYFYSGVPAREGLDY